jgi:hypothetical protein
MNIKTGTPLLDNPWKTRKAQRGLFAELKISEQSELTMEMPSLPTAERVNYFLQNLRRWKSHTYFPREITLADTPKIGSYLAIQGYVVSF